MVCKQTFQDERGNWLYPNEVEKNTKGQYVTVQRGEPVIVGRSEKMSKSKNNVVEPRTIIDAYGADVARLFILSDTPPERDFDWNDEGVEGAWRYINRIWRLGIQVIDMPDRAGEAEPTLALRKIIHQSILKFQRAFEGNAFHKAIAFLRELTRALEEAIENKSISRPVLNEGVKILLQGLNPIIPHITSELWGRLDNTIGLLEAPWPVSDPVLSAVEEVTIAVQVNGKMRGSFTIAIDSENTLLEAQALALPAVIKDMAGRQPRRMVVIPNRIVNIVV
jgi:leucyl-tRNA synthetase